MTSRTDHRRATLMTGGQRRCYVRVAGKRKERVITSRENDKCKEAGGIFLHYKARTEEYEPLCLLYTGLRPCECFACIWLLLESLHIHVLESLRV